MKTLGVEQSSAKNSIAVLDGTEILAEDSWAGMTSRNQEFFPRVIAMLSKLSLAEEDIDIFSVGLGPGSFTGVRMALSAVNAMACPGSKKVFGVSSGEAVAKSVIDEFSVKSVAVVGDARRERFWCAVFSSGENGLNTISDYSLVAKDEIGGVVKDVDLVVSPEWDRTGSVLSDVASGRCVEESRYPGAVSCAVLAFMKRESVILDVPLPIYLHPAVVHRG